MKEFFWALIILLSFASCTFADECPSIFINDKPFYTEEIVKNDHILVPVRDFFKAFDKQISWKDEDCSISSGNIWIQIGNPVAKIGDKKVTLDLPAEIINNRAYIPVRSAAKCLGKKIDWDNDINKISISDDKYLANLQKAQDLIEANVRGYDRDIKMTLSLWQSCLKNSNNVFKNGVANNIIPQNYSAIYSDFTARDKDIKDMLYLLSKPDEGYKETYKYLVDYYNIYTELKELATKPTLDPYSIFNNHYVDIMKRLNIIKEKLGSF